MRCGGISKNKRISTGECVFDLMSVRVRCALSIIRCCQRDTRQGKSHTEAGSFAANACGLDLATVRIGDGTSEVQAQTCARYAGTSGRKRTVSAIKYFGLFFQRNAIASVTDGKYGEPIMRGKRNVHRAVQAIKFHRIIKKVKNEPPNLGSIKVPKDIV